MYSFYLVVAAGAGAASVAAGAVVGAPVVAGADAGAVGSGNESTTDLVFEAVKTESVRQVTAKITADQTVILPANV